MQQNLLVERSSATKELTGEFFGTDFNFLYSEEMQRALATNCLSSSWNDVMNFQEQERSNLQDDFG